MSYRQLLFWILIGAVLISGEIALLKALPRLLPGQPGSPAEVAATWPVGIHPRAIQALQTAGVQPWRVVGTVDDAPVSAGTHRADGVVDGMPYSAATDFWVGDLTRPQIREFLAGLGSAGFAAWYRCPGEDEWPPEDNPHIHAIYAGCPLKPILRLQVADYLAGRNGLRRHERYTFWQPSRRIRREIKRLRRDSEPDPTATG